MQLHLYKECYSFPNAIGSNYSTANHAPGLLSVSFIKADCKLQLFSTFSTFSTPSYTGTFLSWSTFDFELRFPFFGVVLSWFFVMLLRLSCNLASVLSFICRVEDTRILRSLQLQCRLRKGTL